MGESKDFGAENFILFLCTSLAILSEAPFFAAMLAILARRLITTKDPKLGENNQFLRRFRAHVL